MADKTAFYWRQTTFLSQHSSNNYHVGAEAERKRRRMVTPHHVFTDSERRAIGLKIINRTFADVKKFSVGSDKPGAKGVKAVKVMDVLPFLEFIPNRYSLCGILCRNTLTIFDHDVIEDVHPALEPQMRTKSVPFNGLVMMKNFDYENRKAFALYNRGEAHPLVTIQKNAQAEPQVTLGRCEYHYKREYDYFISTENQLKHNIIGYLRENAVLYVKPSSVLIMSKKKGSTAESGVRLPERIDLDARGYSKGEIEFKNKRYQEIGCDVRIDEAMVTTCMPEESRRVAGHQRMLHKSMEDRQLNPAPLPASEVPSQAIVAEAQVPAEEFPVPAQVPVQVQEPIPAQVPAMDQEEKKVEIMEPALGMEDDRKEEVPMVIAEAPDVQAPDNKKETKDADEEFFETALK